MKIYAVLVFTSLWLIHVRLANANGNHFRQGGPPAAYRRAHYHHPHGKPSMGGQFKKKWYPPHQHQLQHPHQVQHHVQQQQQLSQRPRRPAPIPPPPQSPQSPHYMRQRLGLGTGPPPPVPKPKNEFKLQLQLQQEREIQNQQLQQQQQQQQLSKNFLSKWSNFPSRNLKPQSQPPPQNIQHPQQKPFLSSPKIQSEAEYHIQSNQIPNQPIMIKQLDDEKGPIHTIPAPNLSLADKPKQVHIYQPKPAHHHLLQPHFDSFESTTLRVLKPQPTQHQQQQQQHQYQVTESESPDADKLLQDAEVPPLKPEVHGNANAEDIFGLLPVQDGYAYSVLHQPQLQQHMLQQQQSNAYQTMLVQPQFFQPDPTFLESHQKQMATPPEMHTFNYVEPKHEHISHVSAEYILQADDSDASDASDHDKQDGGESYYSSLPSKDAADSFAALHDAGRRTHGAHDQTGAGSSNQQEMMIYVPDEQEQFDPAEDLEQYEANDGNGGEHGEKPNKRFGFGSRIQPKKT